MGKSLKEKLRALGGEEVRLIVRTRDDPATCESHVRNLGLEVTRKYSLLKALAVKGRAESALKLWDEPWVESVEEDKPVSILKGDER